jgi:putative flavoprotein involved in K+ transport
MRVTALIRTAEGFEARTGDGVFRARQVVATGPFQVPYVPSAAQRLDDSVTQLHSAGYRNPRTLPPGRCWSWAAVTPGSRSPKSLPRPARSTCRSPPTRRCCRSDWRARSVLVAHPDRPDAVTAESRPGRRLRARPDFIIGSSRRRLRSAGVRFRPAVADAEGRTVRFADGTSLNASIVIWTTGYRSDYSWIHIPGLVGDGEVIHRRGVTDVPGLYFLGLPWQHSRGSALLGFVREDAAYLVRRITSHATASQSAARLASQQPG